MTNSCPDGYTPPTPECLGATPTDYRYEYLIPDGGHSTLVPDVTQIADTGMLFDPAPLVYLALMLLFFGIIMRMRRRAMGHGKPVPPARFDPDYKY